MKIIKNKEKFESFLYTFVLLTLGCILYAFSVAVFYTPSKLLAGGITGISQILNYQFGWNISVLVILFNIPLFLIALKFIDKRFTSFSLYGMLLSSLCLSLFANIHFEYESVLTAIALGGVINGLGLGLIYRSEASVGGTDIISKLIQRAYSGNMAYTGMAINVVILMVAAYIYGLDEVVLTICAMYVSSQVSTYLIDGIDHRRAVSIITKRPDSVSKAIFEELHRGVTVLRAYGAYTHEDSAMLYVVIQTTQLNHLKRVIKQIDPNAFFTITRLTGVYGNGHAFHSVNKDIR